MSLVIYPYLNQLAKKLLHAYTFKYLKLYIIFLKRGLEILKLFKQDLLHLKYLIF